MSAKIIHFCHCQYESAKKICPVPEAQIENMLCDIGKFNTELLKGGIPDNFSEIPYNSLKTMQLKKKNLDIFQIGNVWVSDIIYLLEGLM